MMDNISKLSSLTPTLGGIRLLVILTYLISVLTQKEDLGVLWHLFHRELWPKGNNLSICYASASHHSCSEYQQKVSFCNSQVPVTLPATAICTWKQYFPLLRQPKTGNRNQRAAQELIYHSGEIAGLQPLKADLQMAHGRKTTSLEWFPWPALTFMDQSPAHSIFLWRGGEMRAFCKTG